MMPPKPEPHTDPIGLNADGGITVLTEEQYRQALIERDVQEAQDAMDDVPEEE